MVSAYSFVTRARAVTVETRKNTAIFPHHCVVIGRAEGLARGAAVWTIVADATLARISTHLTVEARHRPAIASLRLLAVLTVLFKYTSARQAARASH
jgi:hypothetical protein